MSIQHRIQMCRMLEKMERNRAYSEKLGIENVSTFQSKRVDARPEEQETEVSPESHA